MGLVEGVVVLGVWEAGFGEPGEVARVAAL